MENKKNDDFINLNQMTRKVDNQKCKVEDVKETLSDAKEVASEKVEDLKTNVNEALEKTTSFFKKIKNNISDVVDDLFEDKDI